MHLHHIPVEPEKLFNVSPPPLPPRPPKVIPNLPGAVEDIVDSTDTKDWLDANNKPQLLSSEDEPDQEVGEDRTDSKPRFDSKVRFADDTELESIFSSEEEKEEKDDESSSGESGPPLLRPALSSESLGSSNPKPDAVERRKVALIQAYKDNFLNQVKASRRECSGAAATSILREVPFFREFDDVLPGTIYRLAKLSIMQDAVEGEVLFRQGDEPVDCYVVMRGQVAVHVRSTPQESPRDFTLDYVRVVEDEKTGHVSRLCRFWRFTRYEEDRDMELDDSHRRYVTEGFNTFAPDSDLGTKVASLGRGAAFGELGLMERKPRAASIRCESKCTFVVIRRSAFQKWFSESISADAYRKRLYFISRIAGFQMETLRNPKPKETRMPGGKVRKPKPSIHPVDRFREEEFASGHVLLQEGKEHDPIVYIVKSGNISISRKSRRRSFSQELNYRDARQQRDVPFGKLGPESLYCSLTTLGLNFPEQFTATVSSEACSLYVANAKDLSHLPPRVTEPLLKHIHEVLRPFLCYSGAYQCLDQLVESDLKPGTEEE